MASKSKKSIRRAPSSASSRPARWYQALGKDKAKALIADQRLSRERLGDYLTIVRAKKLLTLSQQVRDLRKYMTGFDAKDGYDLRRPETWNKKRVETVERYGSYLHTLTASPHARVIVRSKKAKTALERFTGQVYAGKHQARAYVVHDPHPDKLKVSVNDDGQIVMEHKYKGVTTTERYFLFYDYGISPAAFVSVDDLIRATKKLLKMKDERGRLLLPKGSYMMVSALHGVFWYAMDRDDIVLNLSKMGQHYVKSEFFVRNIIGYKYIKDEIAAETLSVELQRKRRERRALKEKHKQSNAMRAAVNKWRRKRGL